MPGTTPVYGFPYPEPTDLVADYPALGQQLAEEIEDVLPTIGGLAPATPTSIANSGGTATLSGNTVTFSGVSSVSLNGCFTGDYDNYRVLIRYDTSVAGVDVRIRFRTAGTDNSTSAYNVQSLDGYGSSVTASRSTAQTAATIINSNGDQAFASIEVGQPFAAWATQGVSAFSYGGATANIENSTRRFGFNATTSFDGFSLYPASGTFDGSISVYGYKK